MARTPTPKLTIQIPGYPVADVAELPAKFEHLLVGLEARRRKSGGRKVLSDVRDVDLPSGKHTFTFEYTYPLRVVAQFKHVLTVKHGAADIGWFLRQGALDYVKIYDATKKLTAKQREARGINPRLLNAVFPSGEKSNPYGIWGHAIGDLAFEGLTVDLDKMIIRFDIGS